MALNHKKLSLYCKCINVLIMKEFNFYGITVTNIIFKTQMMPQNIRPYDNIDRFMIRIYAGNGAELNKILSYHGIINQLNKPDS